jgi:cbb3-type cytochrome oxidase maturation protein
MGVIFILIAASLLVALGFLVAFIWSVKNGQYDDDYTPSVRILFEDSNLDSNVSRSEFSDPELKSKSSNQKIKTPIQ